MPFGVVTSLSVTEREVAEVAVMLGEMSPCGGASSVRAEDCVVLLQLPDVQACREYEYGVNGRRPASTKALPSPRKTSELFLKRMYSVMTPLGWEGSAHDMLIAVALRTVRSGGVRPSGASSRVLFSPTPLAVVPPALVARTLKL